MAIRCRQERGRAGLAQRAADKLPDVGATRSLAILPLVDWSGATPDLQGEPGVSYLIKTDRSTILFDVGVNLKQRDPSPLLANMQKLGVSLADFDTVIISTTTWITSAACAARGATRSRWATSKSIYAARRSSRRCR